VSADGPFDGPAPVQAAEDLTVDGMCDDHELEEFLADLAATRGIGTAFVTLLELAWRCRGTGVQTSWPA